MKGQAAFEYMLIVIIAMGFMVPVWIYVASVKTEAYDELSLSYAKSAADRLASTADLVYSQGHPAKVKVSVYLPQGVDSYNFTNNTIRFFILYMGEPTEIFAESRAKMNGTLPLLEGNYWLEVEAVEGEEYDVFISTL